MKVLSAPPSHGAYPPQAVGNAPDLPFPTRAQCSININRYKPITKTLLKLKHCWGREGRAKVSRDSLLAVPWEGAGGKGSACTPFAVPRGIHLASWLEHPRALANPRAGEGPGSPCQTRSPLAGLPKGQ